MNLVVLKSVYNISEGTLMPIQIFFVQQPLYLIVLKTVSYRFECISMLIRNPYILVLLILILLQLYTFFET